jgi:hypothetical protein
MCPLPEPNVVPRTDCPVGADHAVVSVDLSAQYETSQPEALYGAVTAGLTCPAPEALSTFDADTASGAAGSVPRYATTVMSDFAKSLDTTLTLVPASAAVATFV